MGIARGFGIAGALDRGIVAELAAGAERAGYATFWANDTPGGDGLEALAAAAKATRAIQLGVGVIAVDKNPAERIAERLAALGLPEDRLLLGIGSGGLTAGARAAVREAALALREMTTARVVVGALGPRMCEVGGEAADGVLLNWLTPGYVPVLAKVVNGAANGTNRPRPWLGAYVRVALAGQGEERLAQEAGRYAGYPAYAAHFDRMEVQAIETSVHGDAAAIRAGLAAYPAELDEVVVRAIAAEETLAAYLEVLDAAAPERVAR